MPDVADQNHDTIVAVATGSGGAIAIIRLSGPEAISICDKIFSARSGKKLEGEKGFTIHYGDITDGERIIDDVLVTIFRAPASYTGEDMAEISCHASGYIKTEIINLCIRYGARSALPGEFTMRAFLGGKLDLSQAEAVADIIASENRTSHMLASGQLRGGYSEQFHSLREKLLELLALVELELDFSEEDVEFADRNTLRGILHEVDIKIDSLTDSFSLGNIAREGVPVTIVGKPNVGKSSLLNILLNEERAMVSDIAGTTRDTIEDSINIGGTAIRFIDTAGIRDSADPLERMGIERTLKSMEKAHIVLLVVDPAEDTESLVQQINSIGRPDALSDELSDDRKLVVIINKTDTVEEIRVEELRKTLKKIPAVNSVIPVSAKYRKGIEDIIGFISGCVDISGLTNQNAAIVYNTRHYNSLLKAKQAVSKTLSAIGENLSGELLSREIREIIDNISEVTGEVAGEDVLNEIFSKFCIGK